MLKLPLGTVVYSSSGTEYRVTKNGSKYITITGNRGAEYKCIWEENKLVSKSSYTTTTFFTKYELEKRNKLQEIQNTLYDISKDFSYLYRVESELGTLKALLADALNKINEYENITTNELEEN